MAPASPAPYPTRAWPHRLGEPGPETFMGSTGLPDLTAGLEA